jgi:hypothetical protein
MVFVAVAGRSGLRYRSALAPYQTYMIPFQRVLSIGRWTLALLAGCVWPGHCLAADPASAPVHVSKHKARVESSPAQTLCSVGEKTYFSCPVSRNRLVSVCGSKSTSGEDLLQYRVGALGGAAELVYPGQPAPAKGRFQFVDPTFAKARLLNLRFQVAGTQYVIYRYSGAFADPGAGVASRVGNGLWRYTPCEAELDQEVFGSMHQLEIDVDSDQDSLVFPP